MRGRRRWRARCRARPAAPPPPGPRPAGRRRAARRRPAPRAAPQRVLPPLPSRRLGLAGEALVAPPAAHEMGAHGAPRRRAIAAADGRVDAAMLVLDALELGLEVRRPLQADADAVPRDEEAAEEFEKARELRVARRHGDRLVEGEILVHRRLAATECRVDRIERAPDPVAARAAAAPGRGAPGPHLDPAAPLP